MSSLLTASTSSMQSAILLSYISWVERGRKETWWLGRGFESTSTEACKIGGRVWNPTSQASKLYGFFQAWGQGKELENGKAKVGLLGSQADLEQSLLAPFTQQ